MKPSESDDQQTRLSDPHATQLSSEHATQLSEAEAPPGGDPATVLTTAGTRAHSMPALGPGVQFGPYRIVRLLGRGGMGEVYEAEHLEHGRRVALKVVSQRLTGPADRARFLTEGRLAASISHRNCVYVFGSEEIDSAPAITMELLPGGTLKDLVDRDGPLPPAKAVDAVLQLVAGLEAAQAAGILHRDIKPSNCFVDADGVVKIGDFGLSIATQARGDAATAGMFQGTPQFAAPEQIAGDALDVRADLYAVGATLYYLLTAAPPFDDRDLTTLIQRVRSETPRSPHRARPAIPRGLARIVLRLLAKRPADRIATYRQLADELHAYQSTAPTPALLGLRFTAGLIDHVLLSIATMPFMMTTMWRIAEAENVTVGFTRRTEIDMPWWAIASYGLWLVYFAVTEGWGDASIGKRACGLRIADVSGRRVGFARAVARAAVFMLPQWLTSIPPLLFGTAAMVALARTEPWFGGVYALTSYVLTALLFVTMRRSNGFAGVHELATGTRVVVRLRREARLAIDEATADAIAAPGADLPGSAGPFEIVRPLFATDRGQLVLGRDPVLHRAVWLHLVAPAEPAIPPALRDLTRPGRLRWLLGRRMEGEAWDAYEALDGDRLLSLRRTARPWPSVKQWLADLGGEIAAAERDGTLPPLSLDRVWITRAGHARLLDFVPLPPEAPSSAMSAQEFLSAVARRGLSGPSGREQHEALRQPLPLEAREVLEQLSDRGFAGTELAAAALHRLAAGADSVGRWRRAVPITVAVMPFFIMMIGFAAIVPLIQRAARPELRVLSACLTRLTELDAAGREDAERRALDTYVSGRFGSLMRSDAFWQTTGLVLASRRPAAERAMARYPDVTEAELAAATDQLQPFLDERLRDARPVSIPALGATMAVLVVTLTGVICLTTPVVFRGSVLLRLAGVAMVSRDGRPATRLRLLARGLVTWSPVVGFWLLILAGAMRFGSAATVLPALVVVGLLTTGAVWAIVNPARGLHDRLAGTWLVPR